MLLPEMFSRVVAFHFSPALLCMFCIPFFEILCCMRTLALCFLALGLSAQTVTPRFVPGYQATDKQSEISINIVIAVSTPAMRAEDTETWLLQWTSKKKAERAIIEALFLDKKGTIQTETKSMIADAALPAPHNPVFGVPLNLVIAIRFTLIDKNSKVVARAEFTGAAPATQQ